VHIWWRALVPLLIILAGCVDLRRPELITLADAAASPVDAPGAGDGPPGSGDGQDPPDTRESDASPDPLPAGARCDRAGQCASGFCAQGTCCDTACDGLCVACHLAGSEGSCKAVAPGEDPGQSCAEQLLTTCGLDGTCDGAGACRRYPVLTECRPGRCTAGVEYAATVCDGTDEPCPPQTIVTSCTSGICTGDSCAAPCGSDGQCNSGFYCNAGRCAAKLAAGFGCTREGLCATGFCVDGVCCGSACTESCFSCNVAGSAGTCKAVPSGQDPRAVCPAQGADTCGRVGGCNGSGACRLHPANTVCVDSSCSGTSETPARACDGLGVCRPAGATRDCAPYTCGATACAASCAVSSGCTPGFSCSSNSCARSAGLVLFWRFEETSGSSALDSSGNGHNGTYVGSIGAPTSSTNVPALAHSNPRSRQFVGSSRQAVQIASWPTALRLTNDFTLAAWYRATGVDSMSGSATGAEIISGGNVYILRLRPAQVEFSKDPGPGVVQCAGNAPNYLNGSWHHLAAVASRSFGVRVYYDGQLVCSLSDTQNVDLSQASVPSLFVGRHAEGETHWDFNGHMDEVRIYNRPLSGSEIATLAAGRNL
jgi:hypothetical protein